MGLKDLVKKAFLGATDEENEKNKARMREIFNGCVANGNDYKLIYCHMEKLTNAVIAKITKHSNFIVGYKEGEVVVIPVDSELKEYGEAVLHPKSWTQDWRCSTNFFVKIFKISLILMFVNIVDLIFYRE